MNARFLAVAIASAFTLATASAQQYVYPAKGQSPAQQKKDEAECTNWAKQQNAGQPAAAPPPPTATGTTPGAGLRGAARGAVAAEVVGGEADRGAAAGAVVARSRSRQANAAAAQQQQAAASQNDAKARAACLEGKGYTVK
jgi:hypothetical protein